MSPGIDTTQRLLMVAGEASGDIHGASFLRALRELHPGIHVAGVGGPRLRAAGLECLFPAESLSVVGFPTRDQIKTIFSAFKRLLNILKYQRPHLLILIDFPEFNLFLARFAKRYGVPVFYYISPQIWAWREGRVKLVKRVVDKMAVILPFEVDFYRRHGFEVEFVGHPLLDVVRPCLSRETFFNLSGLEATKPLIGLFPGSRPGEVQRHLPLFLEAFSLLKRRFRDLQGVVVRAEGLPEDFPLPVSTPDLKVIKGYQYEVMQHAEAVLLASGTVTLEAAIVGVPMVVAYRLPKLSFCLARFLVKVPYVSLVNLLAGEALVPELLQDQATPESLAKALETYLVDPKRAQELRHRLGEIKKSLGTPGAAWRAAELALTLLRHPT